MLKYIGAGPLLLKGHGILNKNDIVNEESLCESLKGRADFVNVKEEVPEVKPTFEPKPERIAKSKRNINL